MGKPVPLAPPSAPLLVDSGNKVRARSRGFFGSPLSTAQLTFRLWVQLFSSLGWVSRFLLNIKIQISTFFMFKRTK